MARPTRKPIDAGISAWDSPLNDDFIQVYDGPLPIHVHTGDQTDLAATFPPASYDQCFAVVNHTTLGFLLYFSDGVAWQVWKQRENFRTTSAAVVMVVDDGVILTGDAGGAYNVTLPDPTALGVIGRPYNIKRIGAADIATVVPFAAETLDGAANFVLAAQYQSITLVSNGVNWFVL